MRVLLVEDDPSTQRFVALALEDLPLQLDVCDSVAQALAHLAGQHYALVLTDLMLKGESALGLVQQLARQPALLGGARIAVYSAGLPSEVRAQLAQAGVWRMLDKPVPLAVLRDCVNQALNLAAPEAAPEAAHYGAAAAPHPAAETARASADAVESAIATHFAGNRALFLAFRTSCRAQFPQDAAAAREALSTQDAKSLHRLGHSLKTVLLTLGETEASEQARQAEKAARDGPWEQAVQQWPALIAFLERYSGA
jgi:CheY-like chemotaxis protein